MNRKHNIVIVVEDNRGDRDTAIVQAMPYNKTYISKTDRTHAFLRRNGQRQHITYNPADNLWYTDAAWHLRKRAS